jgi:MFS family permease
MTDDLMHAFQVDGLGLGNLAATFFYTYVVAQLFVGILLDKYSPRLLTALAIGLCAVGAYAFAKSNTLLGAQLSRSLIGIGVAFATVGYMKMTAIWFDTDRAAFVGGLLATGAMLGAMFGAAPLAWLIHYTGWRDGLLACALFGTVLALLFYALVRDHNPAHPDREGVRTAFKWSEVGAVFCNKQNWLLMLYGGFAFEPLVVFGGLWGPPYLREAYSLSTTQAGSLASLAFLGIAVGSPLFGLLSDRLGQRRKVMFWGACLSFVAFCMLIYLPMNFFCLSLVSFVFGFATGAFMLVFALVRDVNNIALIATAVAFINTGEAILGAVSEPLLGKLLDLGWKGEMLNGIHFFSISDYHAAFLLLPSYLLLAIFILIFIQEKNN